jgi:predicted amidophosphoribosyltransferase
VIIFRTLKMIGGNSSRAARDCEKCGASMPWNAGYCRRCGSKLDV